MKVKEWLCVYNSNMKSALIRFLMETIIYLIIFIISYLFCKDSNLFVALWLFTFGLASYFYYAISRKNILDLRAVFFGLWLVCLGIAQIRLSDIQVPWSFITWLCFLFAVLFFNMGFVLCEIFFSDRIQNTTFSLPKKWVKVHYEYNSKKTFYAALFLSIMAVLLFCIQIYMKGFVPILVPRYDSYIIFYNRLAIFVNLIAVAAPLAYWSYKNLKLNRIQKMAMLAILPLPTIIFQLAVQRGLFILGICLLSVSVIFLNKKKLVAVLILVALTVFGVFLSSAMRNIPAKSMEQIWQLDNEIPVENTEETQTVITVPSFLYPVYYYCINGIENFNYMVNNLNEHAYGIKQISVLSIILRFDSFRQLDAQYPPYQILPNSTACIITDFYYDFGIPGVIIEMIIWGAVCSFIQQLFLKTKRACSAVAYGICVFNCVMSFFAAWLSYFSTYLFGGTCFLVFLYINLKIIRGKRDNAIDKNIV